MDTLRARPAGNGEPAETGNGDYEATFKYSGFIGTVSQRERWGDWAARREEGRYPLRYLTDRATQLPGMQRRSNATVLVNPSAWARHTRTPRLSHEKLQPASNAALSRSRAPMEPYLHGRE